MPLDAQKLSDKVQIIDVRELDEWDSGHLELATNIPLGELAARIHELDTARPIVTVCRTGRRSQEAVQLLRSRGFDAESLEGGMETLTGSGTRVVDAGGQLVADSEEGDELSTELAGIQDAMLEVMSAMQERFGDRERTEAEELEFMREFLAKKGKSSEQIGALVDPDE